MLGYVYSIHNSLSWNSSFQQCITGCDDALLHSSLSSYLSASSLWCRDSWEGKGQIRVVKRAEGRILGGECPVSSAGRLPHQTQWLMLAHIEQNVYIWFEGIGCELTCTPVMTSGEAISNDDLNAVLWFFYTLIRICFGGKNSWHVMWGARTDIGLIMLLVLYNL